MHNFSFVEPSEAKDNTIYSKYPADDHIIKRKVTQIAHKLHDRLKLDNITPNFIKDSILQLRDAGVQDPNVCFDVLINTIQ